ncbi:MAG: hypothetical protein IH583_04100, partial [Candidatus Aminicenantes bacterium]|nr:hypothetical protein [Candidatus Aminicenantes bacterium]
VIMKELETGSSILSMKPSEDDIENERPFDELVIEVDPAENYQEVLSRIANMTDVEQLLEGEAGTDKNQMKKVSRQEKKTKGGHDAPLVQTVKVGMDKLDELLDDVGELVIGRSRLVEKASSSDDYELQDISSLIDALTSGIQAKVLAGGSLCADRFQEIVEFNHGTTSLPGKGHLSDNGNVQADPQALAKPIRSWAPAGATGRNGSTACQATGQ